MTVLTFPAVTPSRTSWSLVSNTQSFTSPLSKATQTLAAPGARWQAVLTFDSLTRTNARILFAFLVKLNGSAGRFYLYDHSLSSPMGSPSGSPMVNGAGQTGSSLVTDNWYTNAITWDNLVGYVDDLSDYYGDTIDNIGAGDPIEIYKTGDYFSVNGELKMLTEDVDSDASGNATLPFAPPFRASPADNAPITYTQPKCIMRLIDDNQANMDAIPWAENGSASALGSFSFTCIESFT